MTLIYQEERHVIETGSNPNNIVIVMYTNTLAFPANPGATLADRRGEAAYMPLQLDKTITVCGLGSPAAIAKSPAMVIALMMRQKRPFANYKYTRRTT